MSDNLDRLLHLLNASEALGPWMSAALEDPNACDEFKAAADDFLTALHNLREVKPCLSSPN